MVGLPRFARALALGILVVASLRCGSNGAAATAATATSSSGSSSGGTGGMRSCPPPVTPPADAAPLLAAACDPMVPTQCGFPFPSNVYLVDDATTVTKKRVAIPKNAMPFSTVVGHVDPKVVADSDGFSPGQTIVTHMPRATITGLPTQDTLPTSITTSSPTILLNADTGQLVPHFAELDEELAGEDDSERALLIRPVVRLADATRYIVAIRHVVDMNHTALAPTPVFKALRDGTSSCDPSVALRAKLYADIFAKLAAAGIPKDDLQLAWDYSTASRENNTRWFLKMRDEALAQVGNDGPAYVLFPPAAAGTTPDPTKNCNNLTVSTVNPAETQQASPSEIGSGHCSQDSPNPHIWRRLFGLMTVPIYTTTPNPGAGLNFGPDGMPAQNGMAQYEFEVQIPMSATMTPGAPLQNGHGLLGNKTEGDGSYLAEIDDAGDFVSVAVDLIGFSHDDDLDTAVANTLVNNPVGFKDLVGRQQQGLLNELLSMRLMNGLAKDPATFYGGMPTIDATRHYYRGDSQGGIFGTTYMAVSTDVTRGVLGEPGAPYSLLLNRSQDFAPFFLFIQSAYRPGRDIQLLLGILQMTWDRSEPDGYVPYINQNLLPNTPSHTVLIHDAIGDYQVTPLGAHLIARAVGAKSLSPVNRDIFGIPMAASPIDGSAIVEWSFGLSPAPTTNTPPDDLCPMGAACSKDANCTSDPSGYTGCSTNSGHCEPPLCGDPHDELRIQPASIQQEIQFFNTGTVVETCGGVCVGKFM
jgi:hypothetical protein